MRARAAPAATCCALLLAAVCWCLPTGAAAGSFTVAVLPDTQFYPAYFPVVQQRQTEWICSCAEALNIVYVTHVGDVVHDGNLHPRDWAVARKSMNILRRCGVPYGIAPGNHDVPPGYAMFEEYFGFAYKKNGAFPPGSARNTYTILPPTEGYSFLHVEFEPGKEAIAWARGVLRDHRSLEFVLTTHYATDDCSDQVVGWVAALVSEVANVRMVLGGHVYECGGERANAARDAEGYMVPVVVQNYQDRDRGGSGYLRYYTVDREAGVACAYTYSPTLRSEEKDADSAFSLLLHSAGDPVGPPCGRPACKGRKRFPRSLYYALACVATVVFAPYLYTRRRRRAAT